jgi:two-component system, NarL family, response regulator DevR
MPKEAASRGQRRPGGPHRLGVVLVEPLAVVRAGIAQLIEDRPDLQVLAEAADAEACLETLRRIRRTKLVILVGLGIGGDKDALWLIRTLRDHFPPATILAVGANADPPTVSRSLFVGADGYVDKDQDPVEFLQAIRAAAEGEVVLPGGAAEWVPPIAAGIERRQDLELRLTEREREVLAIAAEGLTAREIAVRLGVRERTVTTHLTRIYGKLGVHGRVGAILEAARSGLVSVGPIGDE